MKQCKHIITSFVVLLACIGSTSSFAATANEAYRTPQEANTYSYRAKSAIVESQNAQIGVNTPDPVDSTIYVLKKKKQDCLGGSDYQNSALKQYLGVNY